MSGVKPARSYSDIREFFEKKGKKSPELVRYSRRGSVNLNNSDNCDILVTQSAPSSPTFKKPYTQQPSNKKPTTQQPPAQQPSTQKPHLQQPATLKPATLKPSTKNKPSIQFTMKPATKFFSNISQAAVEVVMGVAPTPAPGTSNNIISTATTTEPNPPIFTTPEGSFVGAEDQQTPLSKAGDWNSSYLTSVTCSQAFVSKLDTQMQRVNNLLM